MTGQDISASTLTMAPAKSKKVITTAKNRPNASAKRPSRGRLKGKAPILEGSDNSRPDEREVDSVQDDSNRQQNSQALEITERRGDPSRITADANGLEIDIAAMRGEHQISISQAGVLTRPVEINSCFRDGTRSECRTAKTD
jgi:hypothetical protein